MSLFAFGELLQFAFKCISCILHSITEYTEVEWILSCTQKLNGERVYIYFFSKANWQKSKTIAQYKCAVSKRNKGDNYEYDVRNFCVKKKNHEWHDVSEVIFATR